MEGPKEELKKSFILFNLQLYVLVTMPAQLASIHYNSIIFHFPLSLFYPVFITNAWMGVGRSPGKKEHLYNPKSHRKKGTHLGSKRRDSSEDEMKTRNQRK